uniref:Protein OSB1, mitochondrial-like n=1 Tax=Nelumbo nucifera TaxID=4432 RepID=A0A822Z9Y8_NELNU|nr:TPA_asm: hypothetical protein HUJ06_014844 [Nelumbo nucifera]
MNRILLSMWDKMGETSYKHLRRNDLIYVSGQLGSYKKVDANGELKMYYKVIVKELNYVAQNGRQQCCQKPEKSGPKEETISTSSMSDKNVEQKKRDRLYLWQVFFANTYEWWDNRRGKTNSKSPDFKHKDTGEVLWIDERDPPWVKRLLQLHDSTMLERGHQELVNRRPRMTLWKFE